LWIATAVPLRLKVTFKTVEIHSHAVILGDNPSCTRGPPVSIDWKAVESVILDLDEYETSRPPRRGMRDAILTGTMRVEMLLKEGYSRKELARVENEIKVIKKRRRRCLRKGLWEWVQEAFGISAFVAC
jgi:hypothetical protein